MDYSKLKRLLFIALLVVFACEEKEDTEIENYFGITETDKIKNDVIKEILLIIFPPDLRT